MNKNVPATFSEALPLTLSLKSVEYVLVKPEEVFVCLSVCPSVRRSFVSVHLKSKHSFISHSRSCSF